MEKVLSTESLIGGILDQCDPASLCRLRSVSKEMKAQVDWYNAVAFSIDRALRESFFNSPTEFRKMQEETQTVISGSFALQFFTRRRFPKADLDLYVDFRAAHQLCSYLEDRTPYRYCARDGEPEHWQEALDKDRLNAENYNRMSGILFVLKFRGQYMGEERQVDVVIVDDESCIPHVILSFHSSKSHFVCHNSCLTYQPSRGDVCYHALTRLLSFSQSHFGGLCFPRTLLCSQCFGCQSFGQVQGTRLGHFAGAHRQALRIPCRAVFPAWGAKFRRR